MTPGCNKYSVRCRHLSASVAPSARSEAKGPCRETCSASGSTPPSRSVSRVPHSRYARTGNAPNDARSKPRCSPRSHDLVTPTSIAFIGSAGMLVLERNTGKVQRVVNGRLHSTALDLAVNFASERGLLGIALHPDFPANPGVYLFWTCRASVPQDENPFRPEQRQCADVPATGPDSDNLLDVPLARQPRRSFRVGRRLAHLRSKSDQAARVPARRRS